MHVCRLTSQLSNDLLASYASVIAFLSYHFMIIGMNCWQLVMIAEQKVKVYIEVTTLNLIYMVYWKGEQRGTSRFYAMLLYVAYDKRLMFFV